jgi:hypothetical protein
MRVGVRQYLLYRSHLVLEEKGTPESILVARKPSEGFIFNNTALNKTAAAGTSLSLGLTAAAEKYYFYASNNRHTR